MAEIKVTTERWADWHHALVQLHLFPLSPMPVGCQASVMAKQFLSDFSNLKSRFMNFLKENTENLSYFKSGDNNLILLGKVINADIVISDDLLITPLPDY